MGRVGMYSPARVSARCVRRGYARCLCASSRSSDSRRRCSPITAPRLPPTGLRAYQSSRCGGLSLASSLYALSPAHPEQNGRHERMHRTLKAETTRAPAATLRAQQRLFERFQREYNTERPHEALGQRTPIEVYQPSPSAYPARLSRRLSIPGTTTCAASLTTAVCFGSAAICLSHAC